MGALGGFPGLLRHPARASQLELSIQVMQQATARRPRATWRSPMFAVCRPYGQRGSSGGVEDQVRVFVVVRSAWTIGDPPDRGEQTVLCGAAAELVPVRRGKARLAGPFATEHCRPPRDSATWRMQRPRLIG